MLPANADFTKLVSSRYTAVKPTLILVSYQCLFLIFRVLFNLIAPVNGRWDSSVSTVTWLTTHIHQALRSDAISSRPQCFMTRTAVTLHLFLPKQREICEFPWYVAVSVPLISVSCSNVPKYHQSLRMMSQVSLYTHTHILVI